MKRRNFLEALAAVSAGTVGSAIPVIARAAPAKVKFASTTGAVGLETQIIASHSLAQQRDLNLDVKILNASSAEKMILLGQADVGPFAVISAAGVNSRGQDLICFGPLLYMHSYVLVWKDAAYRSLEDLKGKRLSLLSKFSGAYRGMQLIASWRGFDLEHDFHLVTAPPPAIMTFLQRREVDAIVIHEPLVSKLLATGNFRILLGMNDVWKSRMKTDWLFLSITAHRTWLENNRMVARRIVDIIIESCQLIRRDPGLIAKEAKFLGLKTQTEIDLAVQRMPKIFPTEWNDAIIESGMESVRDAVRLKQIPGVPSFDFMRIVS